MPHPTTRPRPVHATPASARGFSLIELLVVIVIIGLIVSIVLPAIASARQSARKADTPSMCNALSQACSQFILDQRRAPGYFSQREMGSQENLTRGFSQMENAMLDLAGGIIADAAEPADLRNVGPTAASVVDVRPSLIGSGSGKAYFTPKSKQYRVQDGTSADGGDRNSIGDNRGMPVLMDTEGMPILMWTVDDTARVEIRGVADLPRFVAESFRDTSAKLYWASNAAFLNKPSGPSPQVGKARIKQCWESALGSHLPPEPPLIEPNQENPYRLQNLAALLGNPNVPVTFPSGATVNQIVPSAPRGSVIIHAAGSNGVYAGRKERAAKRRSNGELLYGDSFVPTREDLAVGFDDILLPVN